MTRAAERPARAWVNAQAGLVGQGNPLPGGAYLNTPDHRSPAQGAYALISRTQASVGQAVAEDDDLAWARIVFDVWAGAEEAAENGAAALTTALQGLRGRPQPAGSSCRVYVADNITGPSYVPPAGPGEWTCFQVQADLLLGP